MAAKKKPYRVYNNIRVPNPPFGASHMVINCWDNKTAPLTVDGEDIFDMNTIDKPKILSVLWGVCDKQQTDIEALQTKVSTLETEIANIKSHLNLQ